MSKYFVGLMSGTSLDGIDAALVHFDGATPHIKASETYPYEDQFKQSLRISVRSASQLTTIQIGQLDSQLGELFAIATSRLLETANVDPKNVVAIGSHGQTLFHAPDVSPPFTLQIGDPNIIAARTGITVVSDLRRKDMALGGQGAPLAPGLHASVFHSKQEDRVVVNIGGIANITLLPAEGPVTGFDTGPGNTLMDAWTRHCKQQPFDKNGDWAKQGVVNDALLTTLKQDPYFTALPPKSTGPEYFNLDWIWEKLGATPETQTNIQTLLTRLTVDTIVDAIKSYAKTTQSVFICGGGAHNKVLCDGIAKSLPAMTVENTSVLGVPPDCVEAVAFAWLARQTINGKPGNIPSVTGARQNAVLGTITPP